MPAQAFLENGIATGGAAHRGNADASRGRGGVTQAPTAICHPAYQATNQAATPLPPHPACGVSAT
jgi:hypothetical protein